MITESVVRSKYQPINQAELEEIQGLLEKNRLRFIDAVRHEYENFKDGLVLKELSQEKQEYYY